MTPFVGIYEKYDRRSCAFIQKCFFYIATQQFHVSWMAVTLYLVSLAMLCNSRVTVIQATINSLKLFGENSLSHSDRSQCQAANPSFEGETFAMFQSEVHDKR